MAVCKNLIRVIPISLWDFYREIRSPKTVANLVSGPPTIVLDIYIFSNCFTSQISNQSQFLWHPLSRKVDFWNGFFKLKFGTNWVDKLWKFFTYIIVKWNRFLPGPIYVSLLELDSNFQGRKFSQVVRQLLLSCRQ